jgi:hypothetical protein
LSAAELARLEGPWAAAKVQVGKKSVDLGALEWSVTFHKGRWSMVSPILASAVAAYQQRHGLDDAVLAGALGCAPAVLTQLRLCRRPGAAEPGRTTAEDRAEIARRFGIDTAALGRVVEEAAG